MVETMIEKTTAVKNTFSSELSQKVATLLESGDVQLAIGYEEGTKRPRPCFISETADAGRLIFDERCSGNLAVYLTKKELIGDSKVVVTASYFALRSILRLLAENQINLERLVVLTVTPEGKLIQFENTDDIADYIKSASIPAREDDQVLLQKLEAMTREERWAFWSDELSKCFKCYACRAACPMCYCTKCIVEENRPQWIQPWASTLANIEWHINRAMHMTGRCSDCGACGSACPLGLPVHLLSKKITEEVEASFGMNLSDTLQGGNALSTFKPEDKETFIK